MRKWLPLFTILFAIFTIGFSASPIQAKTTTERFTGTFVKTVYKETQVDKNTTKRTLSHVVVKNKAGKTRTLSIGNDAKLSVDTIPVKIDAFKLDMEIEAVIQQQRIKTLSGKTGTMPAAIEKDGKTLTGNVSYIARNGKNLTVKLDDGQIKNVFYNKNTVIYKNTRITDIGSLHEGDRVKIGFSSYDSTYMTSLVIMDGGVQVAGLYKGTIHRIDPVSRKVILRDEKKFLNWGWYPNTYNSTSSYYYSPKTTIYLDDEPIAQSNLRKYANHRVYLATVNKSGNEQAERIIVQRNEERTYYEPLLQTTSRTLQIGLQYEGSLPYHAGTILIRNGRLVEPEVLGAYGTAFVVTGGPLARQYANIIHISNDGLDSPSLSGHAIYFGKVSYIGGYQIVLTGHQQLIQNTWTAPKQSTFEFHDDTYGVEDWNTSTITATAPFDKFLTERYGYFYVKDDEIIAAHFLKSSQTTLQPAKNVSAGRLAAISPDYTTIDVRNASQWQNGAWTKMGAINKMNIQQATFIKNGRVIQPDELRINDRLYITGENTVEGKIIKVD